MRNGAGTGDQRWTLDRIRTLIGKLFHVGYTVEGTWKLTRRRGAAGYRKHRARPGRLHLLRGRDRAGTECTWAPRGARPAVKVHGAGGGRVSIAAVACCRPGDRPHLFCRLRACHRRRGEPKGFTWADYRDLIIANHRNLPAPPVWC